jgi:hypothetical protein
MCSCSRPGALTPTTACHPCHQLPSFTLINALDPSGEPRYGYPAEAPPQLSFHASPVPCPLTITDKAAYCQAPNALPKCIRANAS